MFEDATNTYNSPCLIGPPSVEFAPYGRTPAGRRRVDARAGTIDQDPEFMAFLEDLANPTTGKEVNADSLLDPSPSKHEKVTMTPLVQALKDKKASKNKDAAAKAAKKQEANSSKGKSGKDSVAEEKKKGKEAKTDRLVDKATKEAVKILNREAASKSVAGSSATSEASGSESSAAPKLDIGKVPGRQRQAVVAAHIRMLQRDLGLSPAQAHRQVRRDTADAQKAERAAAAAEKGKENADSSAPRSTPAQPVPTAPKSALNQTSNRKGRGKASSNAESEGTKPTTANNPPPPMVLLKKPEAQPAAASSSSTPPAKAAGTPTAARRPQQMAAPSEGATQAFVKHANPSQGVTEALLKEAMEKFGTVTMVEIDRRKGFAYVDFADTDGLKKAMAANPISVAQGTVQVMQRKGTALPPDKKATNQVPSAPARGGRGGRGGGGGTVGRRGGRGGGRGGAGASDSGKAPSSAPTGPSK